MKLTKGQKQVLNALDEGPLETKTVSNFLNKLSGLNNWGYDRVHSILRRLEDRELVRRLSGTPTRWELTSLGRRSI